MSTADTKRIEKIARESAALARKTLKKTNELETYLSLLEYKAGKVPSATVDEAMLLIGENPAAPSLRTHVLKGTFAGCFAARLSREYRIVFVLAPDRVTFIDIGTHDDVYR